MTVSPGLILILAALPVPLLRGAARKIWMLAVPALGFAYTLTLVPGLYGSFSFLDLTLTPLRVDGLSLVFAAIFLIAAFLGNLFALGDEDALQQAAALIYAGSAVAAVFAGDLVTLFVCWEMTAVSSVFLIWARGGQRAYRAGMRYLVVQVGSGVLLLFALVLIARDAGTVEFGALSIDTPAGVLILVAFGIKCAFPLLHNWMPDAYPEATAGGTVILSAFTTKLAVYALARGFAGTEALIYIGAAMTVFPIFYALIENDLRRVLAHSLNNQLGFMVVGIGVGTELALNGAVAHAFAHILYKALLFMSMGAVLHRTGTIKATELGGLYRSMPWTAGFCIVGAASISGFPLFSGFVTKAMILTAVAGEGRWAVWGVMMLASAGVLHYCGIRVPYLAFFARDAGRRCAEAPAAMLLAMAITALLCVGIGVWPAPLYALLPFPVDYAPYTTYHIVNQLQLLLFSALAFVALVRTGVYPSARPSTNLDTDVVYRKLLPTAIGTLGGAIVAVDRRLRRLVIRTLGRGLAAVMHHYGPDGALARTWRSGSMAFGVVALLGVYLILFLL